MGLFSFFTNSFKNLSHIAAADEYVKKKFGVSIGKLIPGTLNEGAFWSDVSDKFTEFTGLGIAECSEESFVLVTMIKLHELLNQQVDQSEKNVLSMSIVAAGELIRHRSSSIHEKVLTGAAAYFDQFVQKMKVKLGKISQMRMRKGKIYFSRIRIGRCLKKIAGYI